MYPNMNLEITLSPGLALISDYVLMNAMITELTLLQKNPAQRRNVFSQPLKDDYLEWNIMQRGGRNYSIVHTNMGVCTWGGETFLDDWGLKLLYHWHKIFNI